MSFGANNPHAVFVSYSQESESHVQEILGWVKVLRERGIDAWIDQYVHPGSPAEGWRLWCYHQIKGASHVLVVCTEVYTQCVEKERAPGDSGRGATWEAGIITNEVYDAMGEDSKFLPVVLTSADGAYVPYFLGDQTVYDLSTPDGSRDLIAVLTGQPTVPVPPLGPHVDLSSAELRTPAALVEPAPAPPPGVAAAMTGPQSPTPTSPSRSPSPSPSPSPSSAPAGLPVTSLSDVILGVWVIDVQNPMYGYQSMQINVSADPTGRRFASNGIVGPPGWQASGEWAIWPGGSIVLQGLQTIPTFPPQTQPLQETFWFQTISHDLLQGVMASVNAPVRWRRQSG